MRGLRVPGTMAVAVAVAGCTAGVDVGGSKEFNHDRSYAASAGKTYEALQSALRDLSFPVNSADAGKNTLIAEVNWAAVTARGQFEIGRKDPTGTELRCRVEKNDKNNSTLFLTVYEPGGISVELKEAVSRHHGDVAMTVFNKTQDRLSGGEGTAEKGGKKTADRQEQAKDGDDDDCVTCKAVKKAGTGWCTECKMGYVNGRKTDCEDCVIAAKKGGKCKTCGKKP